MTSKMSKLVTVTTVVALGWGAAACSTERDVSSGPGAPAASSSVADPATTVDAPATTPATETATSEPPATTAAPATTSTEGPTSTGAPAHAGVRTYFLLGERLVIDRREVTGPAVLAGAIEQLLAGPSVGAADDGVTTAIPTDTALLGVNLVDGVATIDLTGGFESGGGTRMMQARLAQVVFTATQFDNVDAVTFWLDGEPVDVFGGEGIELTEPQRRVDVPRDFTFGIIFDLPERGAEVPADFTVSGEGDVFEGDFPLTVRRDGVQLGQLEIVGAGAFGAWGDFSVDLSVVADPGPIEVVGVDEPGCSPPECPAPTEVVLPLVLTN